MIPRACAQALALGLLLAGCLPELPQRRNPHLVEPPPAPQGMRPIQNTFALSMINQRQVQGVRMRIFNTGTIKVRGEAVSSMKSYHAKIGLDIPVFLVEHPRQGLILFGTGLSPREDRRPKGMLDLLDPYAFHYGASRGQDIVSQLAAEGHSPSDVQWVVISHLHAEQAGMIDSFPQATIVVSRREWEWHKQRQAEKKDDFPLDLSLIEGRIKLRLLDIHNAPAFGAFDNGLDLFQDGSIILVTLPGHTPGNMGAWVNLDGGPVLLTGGAAFVVDNYLDLALPIREEIDDVTEYWRSLHIIRAMRDAVPQLVVFPAHDLAPRTLTQRDDFPLIAPRAAGKNRIPRREK